MRTPNMNALAINFRIQHIIYSPEELPGERDITKAQNAFWLGILESKGRLKEAMAGREDVERFYSKVLTEREENRNTHIVEAYCQGLRYFERK